MTPFTYIAMIRLFTQPQCPKVILLDPTSGGSSANPPFVKTIAICHVFLDRKRDEWGVATPVPPATSYAASVTGVKRTRTDEGFNGGKAVKIVEDSLSNDVSCQKTLSMW